MSGTSLDGVDAALVRFDENATTLVATIFQPFDEDLRKELLALNQPTHNELQRAAQAGNVLAGCYSSAITGLLAQSEVDPLAITAIGCHGQTIRHRPELGFTLQIGNAALLAELSGIRVIADFRSRDIAAGGQGAPLVPAFHSAVFRSPSFNRLILNIGGISNLSWLPTSGDTTGFDCGPGNLLLDAWTQIHLGTPFDHDGAWAAKGCIHSELLSTMLAHPFFAAPPPKSTGRDIFHLDWLQPLLPTSIRPEDVQATLLELSSRSIADAILQYCADVDEIYLCGGGAHNSALKRRIAALLPGIPILLTDALDIGVDWVEATAFAWLARQTQHGQPGNLPEVTGARSARILGAIYPA